MFTNSDNRRTRASILTLFATVALAAGCPGSQPIVDLNGVRDTVLPRFFIPSALDEIGWIPLRQGSVNNSGGFAVGDDPGSRMAAVLYGYPNERQVLTSSRTPADSLVFHEYIHQSDYSNLISRRLFQERLDRLRDDPGYEDAVTILDARVDSLFGGGFLSDLAYVYDDGLTREAIAYLIQFWAQGRIELPEYMLEVYSDAVDLDSVAKFRKTSAEDPVDLLCFSGFYYEGDSASNTR